MNNAALEPVADKERVFAWRDHASLWFSLGVGLLVVQTGAWLIPAVGTKEALFAIVLGSVIGSGLLAWVGRIACLTGLPSAGLMHGTFGSTFARLPVFLNIVQLVGWTTFELVVMRDGTLAIIQSSFDAPLTATESKLLATALWGIILLGLLSGSMIKLVRQVISHVALPLVVLSLLWLTWQFGMHASSRDLANFWARQGNGSMSFLSATDLVIAMPVSWLPLVSDYARHGRLDGKNGANKAFSGIFLGYAIANIWCYGLGVMIVASSQLNQTMLQTLLLAQGGLVALGFILIDELDNTYGDVFSAATSTYSILPNWSVKRWGLTLGAGCICLSWILPMDTLEPFLLMLSSIFVPLYGVILGRLGPSQKALTGNNQRINLSAAVIWLLGIIIYHALAHFYPAWGSALPTLIVTFALSSASRPPRTVDPAS